MIIAFVPCRLQSTRLPNKGIQEIYGISAIERCLINTQAIPGIDKVVLATSTDKSDDQLEDYNLNGKVEVARGPIEDVLERFMPIIKKYKPDHIVRVTGDCPLVSIELGEITIANHLETKCDATYTHSKVALGTACEIYKTEAILRLKELVPVTNHSEYLIYYFSNNPGYFSLFTFDAPKKFLKPWRLTLDEPNDLELLNLIYKTLDVGKRPVSFDEIMKFFQEIPEAAEINYGNVVKYRDNQQLVEYLKEQLQYKMENFQEVLIRADGSSQIGLGHITRSTALACMLKERFIIKFFSLEIPTSIMKNISSQGFEIQKISSEEEFVGLLTGKEIVVLDNYYLDSTYQKEIKKKGCKLVCVDDVNDKEFFADLIINHAPGFKPTDYKAQSYSQFALGLDYALLRPAFLEKAKEGKTISSFKTVLICFGGSDPKNLTKSTLEVVLNFPAFKKINVIVGESYSFHKELESIISSYNNVELYKALNENEMRNVIGKSDVAIIPSSSILLEVFSAGLVVISGMYVANQKKGYENFKKENLFIDAKNFSKEGVTSAIEELLQGNFQSSFPIDGWSGRRILKLFKKFTKEKEIFLRKAKMSDSEKTFNWVNNPIIRKFSFTQKEILFDEHLQWFEKKIVSQNCLYLIAEKEGRRIGSIRFDMIKNEAVISYLVDPEFHGEGFGIILLLKGLEVLKKEFENLEYVVGCVMAKNIASIKAFERLGYSKINVDQREFKFIKKLN